MTVSGAPHLLNNPQWNYGLHNLSLQAMDGKGGIAELDVDLIVGIRQEQQRSDVIDVILGSNDSDVITSGRGDITYGRDGNDHFRLSTEHNANIPSYVDTVFIGGKGADSYYVEKDQIISISDDDKSNILILGAGLRKEDMRITKYYGMGTQYTNQITFIGSDTVISFDQWHLFNQIRFANGDVLDGQNFGATTIRTETSYEPTIWTFDSGSVFETNPNEYNILDIEHAFSVNPDTGGSGFGLTGQSPSFNGFRFLGAYLQDGSELPSWLKFDKATGRLFGTALETDTDQSFIVTIKTIDKDGVTGYFDISLNINLGVVSNNSAPVIENIQSDLSINEKDYFTIVLPENLFSDPDGDQLAFSITLADGSALPSWLTYNTATRTLSGTPQNDQVGELNFKITATDPKGLSTSQEFKLTVNNVNDAPIAHGSLSEQTLKEGEAWQFALPSGSFIDIDKGDALTYSLRMADGSDIPSWLQIDAQTGLISGVPTSSGSLGILIVATDQAGATASHTLDLNIGALVVSNQAPMVINVLGDQSLDEKAPFSIVLPENLFSDPDGDQLIFNVTLADGSAIPNWLAYNAATRTLSGTPQNDQVGELNFKITAIDPKGLSASQNFKLSVNNVNDAPTAQGSLTEQTLREGEAWQFTLPSGSFTDVDKNDVLTYSLKMADGSTIPSWLRINAQTGLISGIPTGVSNLSLIIVVTDKAGSYATHNFSVKVVNNQDVIYGTSGNDNIKGPVGDTTIYGGAGNDTITDHNGNNTIYGGDGADTINGHGTINGGAGGDTINLSGTNNTVLFNLGDGGDVVWNAGSTDKVVFGEGITADMVELCTTDYSVYLKVGNDELWLGNYYGNVNNQLQRVEFADGTVWADIRSMPKHQYGRGSTTINGLSGDSIIHGSDGNDTITDNSGNNIIYGGAGDDTIQGSGTLNGGAGNDKIIGTGANNVFVGGTGNDVFSSAQNTNDTYLFNLGDGQDIINNDRGNDKIIFGKDVTPDMIHYEVRGNDLIIKVGNNGDQITLVHYLNPDKKEWTQTVNCFEFADGTVWEDIRQKTLTQYYPDTTNTITGTPWNDIIYAGSGNDTITDNSGTNIIYGGAGNDTITGKGTIIGGEGNDWINATVVGSDDTFLFNLGDGQDVIINRGGVDKIIFGEGITSDMILYRRDGNNLYIVVGDKGDQIALSNYFDTSKYSNGQNVYQTIHNLEFADGHTWDFYDQQAGQFTVDANIANQVNNLISAMATFSSETTAGSMLPVNSYNPQTVTLAASGF